MPLRRCPLCNQPLPEAVTHAQISSGIAKLASSAVVRETRRIEEEYRVRLADDRRRIQRDAEERVEQRIEARLRRDMQKSVRAATMDKDRQLEREQADRKREQMRSDAENARLRADLENMTRKLEKQSGEQRGEEAELDLYTQLRQAFPTDRITRIGKGVKGADVVQEVMDGTNISGRIVYESKNVASWQNAFLRQALKYRTQYETAYVLVVSRVFPKKEEDFCVAGGIPVVAPRMAVAIAALMREAVIEIARLRLTGAGKDKKVQEILDYILSDRFATRFNSVAECIYSLRDQQCKEKRWHENSWEERSAIHERLDQNHREIGAHLKSILNSKQPVRMAARA